MMEISSRMMFVLHERSPDLEGAVGNDLDFFVPPSGNISRHDRKELQHLQDEVCYQCFYSSR